MALELLPGMLTFRIIAVLALVMPALVGWTAEPAPEMLIEVTRSGGTFLVNAMLFAPVPPREAWAVLTDFDRMSAFVPNLSESRVISRSGDQLVVAQKGVARFGVLSFPFESVREVELHPYDSIRSHNIRGNISRLDSVTRLSEADGGTRISYRVEVIPGFWFPGFIGEVFLKDEIAEQFDAIAKEMLRRRGRSSRVENVAEQTPAAIGGEIEPRLNRAYPHSTLAWRAPRRHARGGESKPVSRKGACPVTGAHVYRWGARHAATGAEPEAGSPIHHTSSNERLRGGRSREEQEGEEE